MRSDPEHSREDVRFITDRMDELLYREEMMWLQRSRITWLREGDRNTSYFHRQVVWRARKNKIKKLKREDGTWCEEKREMHARATDFFQRLYTADPEVEGSELLQLVPNKISEEMNSDLCKPFSEQEIADALFQMGPLKAPGPNGFPARFFQRHWTVVKNDIVIAVQKFFMDGVLPEGMNDTSIVLIPKVPNPEELKDLRPISLCNVVYKIISKCLVNRLRPILDGLISPEQSAFVPVRRITDNALIAFECIHAIQHGVGDQQEFGAYKLDLAKAYDRVDSGFLQSLMEKLGFHHQWVQWIMACVTTVRYTVRFSGTPLSPFVP